MTRRSLLLGAAYAFARHLSIAPAPGASFVLEVEKTGLLAGKKHRLVFSEYRGQVTEQVTFTVRAASMQCEDTWVNEKDRAKILKYGLHNLLEAETYPEIRFVSTTIRPNGDRKSSIEGDLTIRQRSHPVVVTVEGEDEHWWKGSTTILLSDFGLKPPTAALGAIGTKNQMRLAFRLMAS